MSDFFYIDQNTKSYVEKTSQANISKGLYNNYQIRNSCIFNASSDQYLSRTFNSTPSTYTISCWVKKTVNGSSQTICASRSGASYPGSLSFNSSDQISILTGPSSSQVLLTSRVFRDPSAWYHIVLSVEASKPSYLYVNGEVIGSFTATSTPWMFVSSYTNAVGRYGDDSSFNFNGYMAEFYFIDGQALDPNNFGYFDNQRDFVWKPKKYTGSFTGSDSFYLNFSNSSSIGLDSSGRNNNLTTYGSMASSNIFVDSPTNNYSIYNPLAKNSAVTVSNNGITFSSTNNRAQGTTFVIPRTGKWYAEFTPLDAVGVGGTFAAGIIGADTNFIGGSISMITTSSGIQTIAYIDNANRNVNGTIGSSGGATYGINDVIGVAVDADNGSVSFYKNNSLQFTISGVSYTTYSGNWMFGAEASASSKRVQFNTGQRAFSSTPPTGFRSLCSANLPVPSIKKPNQYMDIVTFNATGSNQLITGLNFRPDFVWIKNRASWAGPRHTLYDSVRGAINRIDTSTTEAEAADNDLFSFQSNGFEGNLSGTTYVSWAWKGGSRLWNLDGVLERTNTISIASPAVVTLTNHNFSPGQAVQFYTTGSLPTGISSGITYYVGNVSGANTFNLYDTEANAILGGSTGRIDTSGSQSGTHRCRAGALLNANRESGFSIVRYIGTGANASFGHSLGVAPNMVIIKNLETAGTNWFVYHSSIQGSGLYLNSSGASFAQGNFYPGNPWSVGVNVGTDSSVNELAKRHIAYCFAEKEGYSKFGSYTGNGSADGTFVYCGFRPSWIMTKGTVSGVTAYNWIIHDVRRNTFNVANLKLAPNSTQEENGSNFGGSTMNTMDILSNGFKLRTSNVDTNGAGNYIFAAFAETPFKYALAR